MGHLEVRLSGKTPSHTGYPTEPFQLPFIAETRKKLHPKTDAEHRDPLKEGLPVKSLT
jgi:hypothetical protein